MLRVIWISLTITTEFKKALQMTYPPGLSRAEEGSRELDAEIAIALGHRIEWRQARFTGEALPVIHYARFHPYRDMPEPCPAFSTSVDAMLRMLAQTFGDHYRVTIEAEYCLDRTKSSSIASVAIMDTAGKMCLKTSWTGAHPALALAGAGVPAILTGSGQKVP